MNHYQERDIFELDEQGSHYSNHIQAMTSENLFSKSDIAAELGHRDMRIQELTHHISEVKQAVDCVRSLKTPTHVSRGSSAEEVREVWAKVNALIMEGERLCLPN